MLVSLLNLALVVQYAYIAELTLFALGLVHGGAGGAVLLQLGRGDEAGRRGGALPPRLPPLVVVFADYLPAERSSSGPASRPPWSQDGAMMEVRECATPAKLG